MEIHDPETSPASNKLTEGRGSTDLHSNGTAEATTGGIVEQRIMDAAGVQAQQYDSEVNDRDQVFVDCMDTHANTEQRHGRPSDTEETDTSRSADHHNWRPTWGLCSQNRVRLLIFTTRAHVRPLFLTIGARTRGSYSLNTVNS